MRFGGLTIDTNVFDKAHLRLDTGLLAKLDQFKDSPTRFILSDIVIQEVRQHMIKQAERASEGLKKAMQDAKRAKIISDEIGLDEATSTILDAKLSVDTRINDWIAATGAEVVRSDLVSTEQLTKLYFSGSPPFEERPDKKSEFPDAIALLALDTYAVNEDIELIVVSNDNGWIQYGRTTDRLYVVKSLPAALALLNQDALANASVQAAFERLSTGNDPDSSSTIRDAITRALDNFVQVEAGSAYFYDADFAELSLESFELLPGRNGFDFDIIQFDVESIVARLGVEICYTASAEFRFFVDKDTQEAGIPFAGDYITVERSQNISLLITFERDPTNGDALDITDVEVTDEVRFVDFGTVTPAPLEDDRAQDEDSWVPAKSALDDKFSI